MHRGATFRSTTLPSKPATVDFSSGLLPPELEIQQRIGKHPYVRKRALGMSMRAITFGYDHDHHHVYERDHESWWYMRYLGRVPERDWVIGMVLEPDQRYSSGELTMPARTAKGLQNLGGHKPNDVA